MVRSRSRLDCTTRQMKSSVSKPVLNHAWQLKMNTFGRPLDKQNGRLFLWPKCSCVSTKVELCKLLLRTAVCLSSLIIQWTARIFYF